MATFASATATTATGTTATGEVCGILPEEVYTSVKMSDSYEDLLKAIKNIESKALELHL